MRAFAAAFTAPSTQARVVRMQLIGRYDSPYVRRVGVSLHVLGQKFEHLPLSPFSQAGEFRKFSAIGRMPVLRLSNGETLIESAAILDYLDQVCGPERALLPATGAQRRQCLRILAYATAACDKAIAINYERRRPANKIFPDWIARCRAQLDAALRELEDLGLAIADNRRLQQVEITTASMFSYVRRVEPEATAEGVYGVLERLTAACEARREFMACPQE
jgi:glutathione S-transferase